MAAQGAQKLSEIRDDDPVALTVQHELELCRKDRSKSARARWSGHARIHRRRKAAARLWLEVAELQLAYGEHRDAALFLWTKRWEHPRGTRTDLRFKMFTKRMVDMALAEELEKWQEVSGARYSPLN